MPATLPQGPSAGLDLPPHLARQVWRGGQLGRAAQASVPSGHALLDAELPGGGWPVGSLTELLLEQHGIGEMRLLSEALRRLTAPGPASRYVSLIAPPYQPYAPVLAAWGIALERVIWVKAEPRQALWAAQQTLKHDGVGALLLWLPQVRPDALRRLQVLAQDGRALVFLLRPASTAADSSPAPLRLRCRVPPALAVAPAMADARRPQAHSADLHTSCLQVEILKRRGPVLAVPLRLHLPFEAGTGWPSVLPGAVAQAIDQPQEPHHAMDRRDAAELAARSRTAAAAIAD